MPSSPRCAPASTNISIRRCRSRCKKSLERRSMERSRRREGAKGGGKSLGFMSAKGGCGATTLICHVAAELGRLNQKVLLADLDLDAGMVGVHHQDQVGVLDSGRGQQPAPPGHSLLEGAGLQRHSRRGDRLLSAGAGFQAAAQGRADPAGAVLRAPALRLDAGGSGPQPDAAWAWRRSKKSTKPAW